MTALYQKDDPFIASDAVFGVRNSLIVDLIKHPADQKHPKPYCTLEYNFVLPTLDQMSEFKAAKSKEKQSTGL